VDLLSGVGAVLWHGTAQPRVDLHPPGPSTSIATSIRLDMQVGQVNYPFDDFRAALWRGTPESFIDLNPPGAIRSSAAATDGILQGGVSYWPESPWSPRATVWSGTAESFVVVGPPGRHSQIRGMAPGIQVGEVLFPGFGTRASIWHGTPESWTDMHPPGHIGGSSFYATTGRVHVGLLADQSFARAAVNFGHSGAWLVLHQFLPARYQTFSRALAVHQSGNLLYIVGDAINQQTWEPEAVLWIGPAPPSVCYANCDTSTVPPILNVEDFTCFINEFAAGQSLPPAQQVAHYANCDASTVPPVLNVADFACFINAFAAGCP
jgi:hypothetical protein